MTLGLKILDSNWMRYHSSISQSPLSMTSAFELPSGGLSLDELLEFTDALAVDIPELRAPDTFFDELNEKEGINEKPSIASNVDTARAVAWS